MAPPDPKASAVDVHDGEESVVCVFAATADLGVENMPRAHHGPLSRGISIKIILNHEPG